MSTVLRTFFIFGLLISSTLVLASCGSGGTSYQSTVSQGGLLKILSLTLNTGIVGEHYSSKLTASGGGPPYEWSLAYGDLPPGLTLDSRTGLLSGFPEQTGVYAFAVQVQDSATGETQVSRQTFSLTIQEPPFGITTRNLPQAFVGFPYYMQIRVVGGTPPYTWQITDGSLPLGLRLESTTGEIIGIPVNATNAKFTVLVTDSAPSQNVARLIVGSGEEPPHATP